MRQLDRGALWVATVLVSFVFLALPASATAAPRTLVAAGGPISAFAQDGSHIAWVGEQVFRRRVHVRSLRTGASASWGLGEFRGDARIALAGEQVLWSDLLDADCGIFSLSPEVWTAKLTQPRRTLLDGGAEYCNEPWGEGLYFQPLAGDGATLVYGTEVVDVRDPDACSEEGDCDLIYGGGDVSRVSGPTSTVLPGVPGPLALTVHAGRVALAVGVVGSDFTANTVEVRDAATGGLVTSFSSSFGTVAALALSDRIVAALVMNASGGKRIERYDIQTGALLASTWVSPGTAHELDMAGERIIYRTGADIRRLWAGSGEKSLLWRAASTPIGLSIEGRRVAWALNRDRKGYVRAITLPQ